MDTDDKGFNLKKSLDFLIKNNIVPVDVLPNDKTLVDSKDVIEAISKGSDIIYDEMEDDFYFISSDGSKVYCPDLSEGMSNAVSWISDHLPEVTIDIDQGGNVRKSGEAEAFYKIFAIGVCISSFRNDIIESIKVYDFESMAFFDNGKYENFKEYLQSFQNLNSTRINSIISAAGYKISIYKEKNVSYFTGLLDSVEILKLNTLSREIKSVISRYEREKRLNPTDIQKLSKVEKLQLIDMRDSEIEKLIFESEVSTLYRITKLTSERIPPVVKSMIIKEAEIGAREYVEFKKLAGIERDDVLANTRRDIIREANRAVLKTIKFNEIKKYKADPSNYSLKTKS